ncbi:MAG TPA: tetratricopeptide repeat protein [Usitatibacter sp.]|nr:tetratricopeptide repeat protein [Usitatibacter sp.]
MPQQVTHPYGVAEVERLLRLPRSTIRAFVAAGFVSPARGARNSQRFSFQDLIVLRTAQALADARVPKARITRSLKERRRHLPASMPLKGLRIGAVGDHVVVKQGSDRWDAASGQYLLGFEGDPGEGALSVKAIAPPPVAAPGNDLSAQDLFNTAVSLESADRDAAIRAYGQAIAADACFLDARINLGRLLHEMGRPAQAEKAYRDALARCGPDAVLVFNLAVLLDDQQRLAEAKAAYEAALAHDATMADCHYNLALLCQRMRQHSAAIRHMSRYRTLTRAR